MLPAELTNSDNGKPSSAGLANRRFGQAPHCTMTPRPAVASCARDARVRLHGLKQSSVASDRLGDRQSRHSLAVGKKIPGTLRHRGLSVFEPLRLGEHLAAPRLGSRWDQPGPFPLTEPVRHRRLGHSVPVLQFVLRSKPFAKRKARNQVGSGLILCEDVTIRQLLHEIKWQRT